MRAINLGWDGDLSDCAKKLFVGAPRLEHVLEEDESGLPRRDELLAGERGHRYVAARPTTQPGSK